MKTTLGTRRAPSEKAQHLAWWAFAGLLVIAVVAVVALALAQRQIAPAASQAAWPPQSWKAVSTEEHGFDSGKLAQGLLNLKKNNVRIHSLMLVRDGSVLLDAYFYPYDGKTPHDMASVTKTMLTTLLGIAVDQGKLSLDDKVMSFFPDRKPENLDARKQNITVRHLATMTSRLACTRARNDAIQADMVASPDWVGYALSLKMSYDPGTHFEYCNPAIHILSGVLSQATGMSALEYAQQNLFGPLDIRDVRWPADPQGNNHGWGDIHMYPHDLAKIGYLWLNGGRWQGKQIISRQWVQDAVKGHIPSDSGEDYGFAWWVGVDDQAGEYYADGAMGQRLGVYPSLNTFVVMTGGGMAYDQGMEPIIAALTDRGNPLPPNPAGEAALAEALKTIAQSPDKAKPVPPLPAAAKAISGKTFLFEKSPIIKTMRLDFDDSAEAHFLMSVAADEPTRGGPVGLDGVYRISVTPGTGNVPEAFRGRWTGDDTFVLENDRIADREGWIMHLTFSGKAYDRVNFRAQGRNGEVIQGEGSAP
jgi:CubicO group peptidase (beta-lactamase class C family)